jgi:hypothetical protein
VSEPVIEVYDESGFACFVPGAAETQELEAEHLALRVGTVDIELSATGRGSVKVDGQLVLVRSLRVEARVGEMPLVVLEIVPVPATAAPRTPEGKDRP